MHRGRLPAQVGFHSGRTLATYTATMNRAAIFFVLAAVGCATVLPGPRVDASVAPSPAQRWIPPQPVPAPRPPELDPALVAQIKPGMQISLQQLLAYALSNNPQTRSAWLNARAAAAGAVSRRSAYYPSIEVDAQAGFTHQSFAKGALTFEQWALTPSAQL